MRQHYISETIRGVKKGQYITQLKYSVRQSEYINEQLAVDWLGIQYHNVDYMYNHPDPCGGRYMFMSPTLIGVWFPLNNESVRAELDQLRFNSKINPIL